MNETDMMTRSATLRYEVPGKIAIPATFTLFLALLIIISALSVRNMEQLESAFRYTVEIDAKKSSLLDKLLQIIQQQQLIVNDILMWDDPFEKGHLQLAKQFSQSLNEFAQISLNSNEKSAIQTINDTFLKSNQYQNQLLDFYLAGNRDTAQDLLVNKARPTIKKLTLELQELRNSQQQSSTQVYLQSKEDMYVANRIMYIIGAFAILFGGGFAFAVLRQVKIAFNNYYQKLNTIYEKLQSTNEVLKAENKKRKKAEHQIRQHRDELELRVQERTLELQQEVGVRKQAEMESVEAKEKAEEANLALNQKNVQLEHSMNALKNAQDQLVQSEKMASLGGLVAGIAHEINTPLGISITVSSHLEEAISQLQNLFTTNKLKKHSLKDFLLTATESISIISPNLTKAAELVSSFKQVAVDQTSEQKRVFNVKHYLEEILLSLKPQLKKHKHVVVLECPTDLEINSYPGALSQVVTNLVLNAVSHAYDDGHAGQIILRIIVDGQHMQLQCIDDGKGIAKQDIGKIFDPFFTTGRNQGCSGLGLHIVYNIVHQNLSGKIECESTLALGTTFFIDIPIK